MSLYGKLSRVTNVNYYNFTKLLEEKCRTLTYEDLTLQNLVTLYQIQGESEQLIKLIVKNFDDSVIDQILEIWKQNGEYNEQLLQLIKGKELTFQRIFSLIYANVQDR